MQPLRMSGLSWIGVATLAIATWFVQAKECAAGETEHRDFSIHVDGKRAGAYHMTITRADDGSIVMSGHADVQVSYLVYRYVYNYRGTEVWKDNRLQRLDSNCNDNGKKFTVNALADSTGLHVKTNSGDASGPANVWTTTYWKLPEAQLRNQGLSLLDCDTGRVLSGKLQHLGAVPLNAGGTARNCARYRLTGEIRAELWYDDEDRLVREDTVEDGHRTVIELVRVRH